MLIAHEARPPLPGDPPAADRIVLGFAERDVRRRRLTCASGAALLVDLAEPRRLGAGWRLVIDGGGEVEVVAATEDVAEIAGPEIARYAWHLGNRHTPCEVKADRLVIARDHVLEDMLRGLGAVVRAVRAPFEPEGGAYGGNDGEGHRHGAGHGHSHGHHHGDGDG